MSVLTKPDIFKGLEDGTIVIDPLPEYIGPNSVDLRLHDELKVYDLPRQIRRENTPGMARVIDGFAPLDACKDIPTRTINIPKEGLVLEPGELYLGRTVERTFTPNHVPTIGGRSSTGRLGICVHQTAGFGDVGFNGTWTLEITVVKRVRIYAEMRIAQLWLLTVSTPLPKTDQYQGRYQGQTDATPYKSHLKD